MDRLNDYLQGKKPEFSNEPWYNQDGDCLNVLFRDVAYYAERVDGILTVFRDVNNDDIVGCQIKGLRYLARNLGELGIVINEHPPLSILIMGSYFTAIRDEEPKTDHFVYYQKVLEQVGHQSTPQIPLTC
jgi:hypothetical protein